ncbi:hypothetical protein HRJ34_09540 [Rhizorhabdus wittichii]|uniref:Uncharacterized protein n=1 Tax=Rhizorhabdus wittichii TaxID=160791 RepID=A0A975D6C5_9SPHN|nr:hypothetical protein [Rhizorhabdus wittichii]QTH23717.1 hypothetical protein HRJ34_09540 [Rhizorhabdus wittichii]
MIPDFHSRPFARLRKPELRLGLGLGVLAGGSNSGPAVTFDFLAESTFDSRIAFTRGSAATRVNAAGIIETVGNNVPRFDYDPVTLEMRGLLIEEPRTNYLIQSEFADGLPASRGPLVTATTFAGLISGTGLAFGYDGTSSPYFYVTNYAVPASSPRVISIFARMDDGGAPAFGNNATQHPANDFVFNLGGTVLAPTAANGGKVESYGGGLYRISLALTTSVAPGSSCGVIKYAANSARTFKVSGIMVEAGSFATSYIPTGASTVTRAPDFPIVSGANFSGWFNPNEGAFVAEFESLGYSVQNMLLTASDGSNSNLIELRLPDAANTRVQYTSGGMLVASMTHSTPVMGIVHGLGTTYKVDDFVSVLDGAAPLTDTAGTVPVGLDRLGIGHRNGTFFFNGHIRSITYYNRRLPNADLQRLTA